MVALHHRAVEPAHDVETLVRVGVVADHVAEADEVRAAVGAGVVEDGVERLQVGVNVSKEGEAHGDERNDGADLNLIG